MAERAKHAYRDWQDADGRARAAEARMKEAWEAYDLRNGEPPSQELMAEVSRLRAIANDRLTVAMMLMSTARS
jgi:hypothetical protein